MIAALLFIVGLATVVVTVVMVGFNGSALLQSVTAALQGPTPGMLDAFAQIALGLRWTVTPLVVGLLLMGVARIIMLLGAINRSLRGTP